MGRVELDEHVVERSADRNRGDALQRQADYLDGYWRSRASGAHHRFGSSFYPSVRRPGTGRAAFEVNGANGGAEIEPGAKRCGKVIRAQGNILSESVWHEQHCNTNHERKRAHILILLVGLLLE